MTGVADTSVTLRRTHFRAADDPRKCAAISRQIVAGKIQRRGQGQADDATVAAYLDNFVAHSDEVAERRTVDPTCPHQIECN